MPRHIYTPAQLTSIARRGRDDGWSRVEITCEPDKVRIVYSNPPALEG